MKFAKLLIISSIISACGAQENSSEPQASSQERVVPVAEAPQVAKKAEPAPTGALAIGSKAELPACDEARENGIVYVRESLEFLACAAGTWTEIAVSSGKDGDHGKDGKDGRDGASGKDGAKGADGVSTQVASTPIDPGEVCAEGGVSVVPYVDADSDGQMGEGEATGDARAVCDGETGGIGATGEKGSKGDQGQKGDDGADGIDNHVVRSYACSGNVWSARLHASTPADLTAVFSAKVLQSGDTFAKARIEWMAGGMGYLQNVSDLFPNGIVPSLQVIGNYAIGAASNVGYWTWTLNAVAETATVVYYDADLSPATETFTTSCVVTNY